MGKKKKVKWVPVLDDRTRTLHRDMVQYGKPLPFSIWSIKGNVVMKHNHWYLFEPLIGGYYQAILTGQAFTTVDEVRKALKDYPKDEHKKIVARLWYDGAYMPDSEFLIWTAEKGFNVHDEVIQPRNVPPAPNISDMVDPLRKPAETALIDIRAKVDEARALLKQVDDIREELFRSHKVTSTITENTVGYVTFGVAPFARHTLNSKVEL